jgi:hypothetical protein
MEALADVHADVTAMVRVEARAADLPGTPRHVVATLDQPPSAEVLREFDWIRQGGADTVTGTVRELTGADPRTLHEWLSGSRVIFDGLL